MKHHVYLSLLMLVCLTSCEVGPDYTAPTAPNITHYTGENNRKFTQKIPAQWWENFQSPALNQLIELSINNNYSLAAMRETLKQAQASLNAAQGISLPQINATSGVGYEKYGAIATGNTNTIPAFHYYSFGPSLTWTLDIFGKNKRTVEQQHALVEYQQEELRSTQLTLIGNIITTVFSLAEVDAQIAVVNNIIQTDEKYLQNIKQGQAIGYKTKKDVVQAEMQLHNDQDMLPVLLQQKALHQGELNILTGKFPADWQAPNFVLDDLTLPSNLPLSLPSQLIRQRPDILAAGALLHAASANVGIATANLYPQITLSANIAQEALSPGQLFDRSSTAAGAIAGLTAPIFSGGMLAAQKHAAEHAYKASYANYQEVVVQAFVQVTNVLHALNHDDTHVLATRKIMNDCQQSLTLIKTSVQLGSTDQLTLLESQRLYELSKLSYIQASAQRYRDTAQLYLAMGRISI